MKMTTPKKQVEISSNGRKAAVVTGGMTKLMIYNDDHGWTYTPEDQSV